MVLEQSINSPCNARLIGQYSPNSPRADLKSEGVTHKPPMDAALPKYKSLEQILIFPFKKIHFEKIIALDD